MGYLGRVVAAIAVAATIGASRPDADPAMVEAGIGAAYDAQCTALMRGEVAAWTATLARDFVPTMTDGTHGTAKTAHDGVAALLASARITDCRIVPEDISMLGDDAVAAVAITMSGTLTDRRSLAVEQHAIDRWTPAGSAWLQKSSTVLEQTVTVDGVVVQHAVKKGAPVPSPT
ncbi:MAG TPA: hypothetical protein VIG46_10795 [Candidatus Baltobacteraceae bacterium]|jgi:ketosteroid isomerase-like protein